MFLFVFYSLFCDFFSTDTRFMIYNTLPQDINWLLHYLRFPKTQSTVNSNYISSSNPFHAPSHILIHLHTRGPLVVLFDLLTTSST